MSAPGSRRVLSADLYAPDQDTAGQDNEGRDTVKVSHHPGGRRRRSLVRAVAVAVGLTVLVPLAGCVAPPATDGGVRSDATAATADVDYPLHTDIISTTFWVGEIFDPELPDGSQVCSTYDSKWAYHWSGFATDTVAEDDPGCAGSPTAGCDGRATFGALDDGVRSIEQCETYSREGIDNFFPTGPVPLENPFYLDVPYDDLNDEIGFDQRCEVIPWADDPAYSDLCDDESFSFMKNRWVEINGPNGETCYGQIQDAGPSHGDLYHDADYVFGDEDVQPIQGQFNNAGMDVSPALNSCLGFEDLDGQDDLVSWRFVETADVPQGPWSIVVTTSGVTL